MENCHKKKILLIGGSLVVGGVQKFVMELLKYINLEVWQIDYLSYSQGGNPEYIKKIQYAGGKVFYAPKKSEGFVKSMYSVYCIVKEEQYDIVWKHTESLFRALDLLAARLAGTKRLILHCHRTKTPTIEMIIGFFIAPIMNLIVTDRFACGLKAGKHLHGRHRFAVIPNGLDTKEYVYSQEIREIVRKQLRIDDTITLVGHVGRLSTSKNHLFLLDIFAEYLLYNSKARLLLVGDGPLRANIEKKIIELGIEKYVFLVGMQSNVNEWLMAMDIFLFPSLYEGMPIGVIEAQFSDLPCLISDVIDNTVEITRDVYMKSLKASAQEWADCIDKIVTSRKGKSRQTNLDDIFKSGYDAEMNVKMIEEILGEKNPK